jgi:hypothetical protein
VRLIEELQKMIVGVLVLQIERNKTDAHKTKIIDTISCTLLRYCVLSIFNVFSKNVQIILLLFIISLRVEVSLFVLSPEIEDREKVDAGNWGKQKKTFYCSL